MRLGVYVHFPFCRVHCSYCAFAVSTNTAMQDRYFDALQREIEARAAGEGVDTVYFGGGTPSRTSREHLERITKSITDRFAVDPAAEFSLEANPEDVTGDTLRFWRSLGVNRVSIGVQSFHESELRPLGRVHGRELAHEAVRLAVASGLRTSLDLILGLPHQTAESFQETLDIAIRLGAGHISIYMLDLEEGSVLQRQVAAEKVKLPDEEMVARLYAVAIERLQDAGFAQYEISNFARPDEESRHNRRYWRREQYFGFGLSAHSFIGERRFANARDLARYIDAPGEPEFVEQLTETEARRETIFLRLRQREGLDYADVLRLCGQEGVAWIDEGVSEGWLRREGTRVAFTPAGFLVSTELISRLF